ncbi:MAG: Exodeoxyribonuclease 7 large subunit, partial [Pseudomonadota bacterium]
MATGQSPDDAIQVKDAARALSEIITQLPSVWIEGQITSVKIRPGSDWVFMDLRDVSADATLNVVFNRSVIENSPTEAIEKRQKFASGKPFTIRSKDFQEKIKQVSGRNFRAIDLTPEQISQLIAAGGIQTNASGGYIPNFASTALQAAISRERSAGVSPSQIYVDQSPALQSSANPMGLMVANRRDEPAGGFQGISRARKEGRNPKTYGAANGFVPNFVQIPQSILNQNTQANTLSITPDPANIEAVNKGFADTAGKIFLLQSALSFLTGAVGDTQNSFTKLAVEASSAAGNISSLLLFGNEIRNIKVEATGFKGALGNFAKGLGIAGVAFGIVSEGLKFANFAIKEFSGENEKAALSSARLADATEKASIKLSDLSKTRQVEIKKTTSEILGTSGYGGLFDIFKSGGEIGSNVNVQQNVAELLTRGVSKEQIKGILDQARKTESRYDRGGVEYQIDVTKVSDVLKVLEQVSESGIGKTLSDQFAQAKRIISSTDVSNPEARGNLFSEQLPQIYGVKNYAEIPEEVRKNLQAATTEQINLNKEKQKQQLIDNNINFGERLNLELAKQRLDSVFQLKQISEESLTPAERILQFQLETLDLSSREKILKESQLKNLDLERKKRIDILSATKSIVDEASKGELSINTEDLDKLTNFLKDNLGKFNNKDFASEITKAFPSVAPKQVENLVASLDQQKKNIEASTDAQKILNQEATNLKLRVDNTNSSLQKQLSILERISQTTESISNLNISTKNLQIGQNEAEISRLEALSVDPNLSDSQRDSYKKRVIDLQKINNEIQKGIKLSEFETKQTQINNQIKAKEEEKKRTRDPQKIGVLQGEIDNLNRSLLTELNNYNNATQSITANNTALDIQASLIGKVAGAYASLIQQLESFKKGAGERLAGAELGILSATDPNALARSSITRQVELQAQSKGLNDQDYYKFVNQETALREKQYELAVETSNVRKIELQRELDLMQQIAGISATTHEERLAKIKEIVKDSRLAHKNFKFIYKGSNKALVSADKYRITQVITNLISNAVKFSS